MENIEKWHLDKEKYRKQIEDSQLFSLDKETECNAYKREYYKLIENIMGYMLAIDEDTNKNYGREILEVSKRCIRYFSTEKGNFLQYFLSSWRVEYERVKKREAFEMRRCGVHITDDDKKTINKIVKYAKAKGEDFTSQEFINKVADALGLDILEVSDLIEMVRLSVVSDESTNDEGENFSLFDLVSSEEKTIEDRTVEISEAIEVLKKIDDLFKKCQERQKPLLSKLMTLKILEIVESEDLLYDCVSQMSFFDDKMYLKYLDDRVIPTARDIASQFCITEQSVSRTFKIFIEKFRN